MKDKLIAVKNHVRHYRGRYAALATLAVCVTIQQAQVKEMNTFLKEHDLLDTYYYGPEED